MEVETAFGVRGVACDVNEQLRKVLLGIGLDSDDGHVRITHGENFHLYGGSRDTHEMMQDHAVKINEKLREREKTLDTVTHEDLREIVEEIGLERNG
jgi:hypothetical protein